MTAPSDRMEKLKQLLARTPGDPFLLYALAMEYKRINAYADALSFLSQTIEKDANYIAAYHQRAQVFELAGEIDQARRAYHEGIDVARRNGNAHAAEEMQAALDML